MNNNNKVIIVSKCLLGYNCKYNGGNNYNQNVIDFLKDQEYIMVCPECAGGLPTPRIPSERKGNQVVNQQGIDVTEQFVRGARESFKLVQNKIDEGKEIEMAILKAKSPSCGYGKIYDGTFTSTLIDGNGIFSEMLEKLKIKIVNENSMQDEL